MTNATDAMTSQYMADVVQAAIECLCANGFQSRTHRLTEVRDRLRATPAGSASGEDDALDYQMAASAEAAEVDRRGKRIAELQAEVARERGRREFAEQWYAERLAKIEEIAKREGLWQEIAAVIANGSGTRQLPDGSYLYDPPTYAQQLNAAKHRAETAEAEAARLQESLRRAQPCVRHTAGNVAQRLGMDYAKSDYELLAAIDAAMGSANGQG